MTGDQSEIARDAMLIEVTGVIASRTRTHPRIEYSRDDKKLRQFVERVSILLNENGVRRGAREVFHCEVYLKRNLNVHRQGFIVHTNSQ